MHNQRPRWRRHGAGGHLGRHHYCHRRWVHSCLVLRQDHFVELRRDPVVVI